MKEGKNSQGPPGGPGHQGNVRKQGNRRAGWNGVRRPRGEPDFCADTEDHIQLPDDRKERLEFLERLASVRMEQAGVPGVLLSGEEIYDGEGTRYRFAGDGYEYGIEITGEAGGRAALRHTLCRFPEGGITVYDWDRKEWRTFDGSAPPFAEYKKKLPDGWKEDAAMEAARNAIKKIYGKQDKI